MFLLRGFRRITTPTALSKVPIPLPPAVKATVIGALVGLGQAEVIGAFLGCLGRYGGGADVQVLVGVSGDGVWSCAKRVPGLVNSRRTGRSKRTGRECMLISHLYFSAEE
jgi:hypothetical protein